MNWKANGDGLRDKYNMCYNAFVLADDSRKLRFNDVASVAIHNRITMCPKRAMSFYFRRLLGQLEPNGIALLAFQGVEHMREIPLTQGKVATVDDDDYDFLIKYNWHSLNHGMYAVTTGGILMHRLIVNAPNGIDVDHIDGNGLNNKKSNLRFATASQNLMNARVKNNSESKLKGVFRDKKSGVLK